MEQQFANTMKVIRPETLGQFAQTE